jgi:Integral membrane protein EMC3/TMCO1-like
MMQRGIETQDMDVRWVSSLSWYFLNLFGLNGLFRLILGTENGTWLYYEKDCVVISECMTKRRTLRKTCLLQPSLARQVRQRGLKTT